MLCISRTAGDSVTIYHEGQKLQIKVLRVRGNRVRLAFDSDPKWRIVRDDAKKKEE